MDNRFIPSVYPPPDKREPAWWFVFMTHTMMVIEEGGTLSVPLITDLPELGLQPVREWYLGTLAGRHCYCAEIPEHSPVTGKVVFRGLRHLYERIEEPLHKIAMRGSHIIEWDRTCRYCSCCKTEMTRTKGMNAKECPGCGFLSFPRISPAVIVLVEKNSRVLLARVKRFTTELYSVIAGFVEPGETLEEAVKREIEEEVGITVKNIRYFGSQPWPFPDSLMIGFTADYESGEIKIDETEIVDAGWYDPDRLPTIPGKISIARELIDWFVEMKSNGQDARAHKKERSYNPDE